jgi:hypothetical protein
MGDSSDEIDRQTRETRARLDQELEVLEEHAESSERQYWRVAAGVGVGLAAVVIGVMIYRRARRRSLVKQVRDVLFESVRDLPDEVTSRLDEVTSRLKDRFPNRDAVMDRAHEAGDLASAWAGMAGKVARNATRSRRA